MSHVQEFERRQVMPKKWRAKHSFPSRFSANESICVSDQADVYLYMPTSGTDLINESTKFILGQISFGEYRLATCVQFVKVQFVHCWAEHFYFNLYLYPPLFHESFFSNLADLFPVRAISFHFFSVYIHVNVDCFISNFVPVWVCFFLFLSSVLSV